MTDSVPFAQLLLALSLVAVAAVLSNRLTARLRIPAPAVFLAAAAIAAAALPGLKAPPEQTVERIVTVALVCILFDGGMHIGWQRFRQAAAPIVVVGVAGTFLTAAAAATVAHFGFGFSWYVALLLGTVIAPTDPAVVFSILGQREIAGRSSTILEGESGANDPVGIALLVSLLAAGSLSGGAGLHVVSQFILQMGVGAAFGLLGGRALLWFTRRVWLPSEGLYPLRTLACVVVLYGATTVAHGSGFLAVFVAGIFLGGQRAPFKREIERFHSALASLGEIVAFVVLGLTVNLGDLTRTDVWVPGLVLGISLALVIRPLLVGLCLIPAKLARNEAAFVLFAGLKGAVPILLGSLLLATNIQGAQRLYGIVVVVVTFSVVVQGGLVPTVVHALHLPMRILQPQPWSFGVRLAQEPVGVLHLTVAAGARAAGRSVKDIAEAASESGDCADVWVNMLVRGHALFSVRGKTLLQPGDEVVLSAEEHSHPHLEDLFRT